ncbi:MAG: outer membrane protein assembly factor BamD [Deltaproteobacteria bacterium]|nr:outer membrane protein assembly factor BamD [Deltaproteobacteria bacterium]
MLGTGRRVLATILAAFGFAGVVSACAETQDEDSLLSYTQRAEKHFQAAMDEFDDEDCSDAEPLFQDFIKEFRFYERYAKLAELRLADCQYIEDKFAEAAVSYEQFVKTYPTHPDAHYAAFRRGLCYYRMIPSDWIITPPPHERDQTYTRDARTAMASFLQTYPESPWRAWARVILSEVEDALVRHEMYVAEFYLSRDDRRAAAVRLEGVLASFPGSRLVPDAMFMQAVTYLEMGEPYKARLVFESIRKHFPDHHQSLRALDYLRHLDEMRRAAN